MLQLRERVRLSGDGDVGRVDPQHLDHHDPVRATLVELARRVQEPRAEAERGGNAGSAAEGVAGRLEVGLERRIHERRDDQRIAIANQVERGVDRRLVGRGRRIAASGEDAAGQLLGGLDVGLVERVDAQNDPGHGGGELPEEHLGAQIRRLLDGEAHRRPRQRPVVTVAQHRRTASTPGSGASAPSPTTGRMPTPCLPVDSAISCSIHRPKRGEPFVDEEGQVVASVLGRDRHQRSELAAEVLGHRRVGAQDGGRLVGGLEQVGAVEAHQGRRNQAERRQGRVPPADLGDTVRDVTEPAVAGQLLERGAGVGDDDEVRGVGIAVPEVGEVRSRLDRAARLRRDDVRRGADRVCRGDAFAPPRGRSCR